MVQFQILLGNNVYQTCFKTDPVDFDKIKKKNRSIQSLTIVYKYARGHSILLAHTHTVK